MLGGLGIADAMQSKLRGGGIDETRSAVASGAVELAFLPVPLIIATQNVELAGALPREFQDYIVMTAGLATAAPQAAAGQAFIHHLMAKDADKVFKAKGFERVAQ
jgi:ABC-type molybdate transport system substrate-binding protein